MADGARDRTLARLSLDEAWRHLHWLEEHAPTRISGTPGQVRAGEYFAETLAGFGLETHLDTFTGYRSVPVRGSLSVLGPAPVTYPAEACGHIVSTPDEGLELDLIYLGGGSVADYEGQDVRGAAVVTEIASGPSRPVKARIAADHGASAIVFLNWGLPEFDTIPCGAIKCVWGNPTRAMMADVPQVAALGVSRAAGDALIERMAQGPVRARVLAQATRDWGPMTQPWARLRAPRNSTGDFLLVGGHYDAWTPGMTDNGGGNALMLELARAFAADPDALVRDIVFAFWNGHEVGDYEGSTWFGDRYWDDLDTHGVAYLNVDSIGFADSAFYLADSTPELTAFHQRVEREVLGTETGHRHLTRDNEHPFFGLGLPALEGRFHFSEEQIAAWGGARGGWWWHSTADTIDKLDPERYRDHARVYAAYVWELCTAPVLPMDFRASASRITSSVTEMQDVAGGRFDLDLPLEPFVEAVAQLHDAAVGAFTNGGQERRVERLNRGLMRLSRLLLPAFETWGGRYAQDRVGLEALSSSVPALHALKLLASTPPESELSHLLQTELLRARNRLSDALRLATEEAYASTAIR
jgi:hypothetical protein